MKRLLLLFCCTLSLISFHLGQADEQPPAKKSVVLLVSLDPAFNPKGIAGLLHNYNKRPEQLAATFNKMFENSGFDVQVIQNADRADLFNVLHSPSTVGVFWVSHIMPTKSKENSIVDVSAPLLDYQLSDVKPLFEEMNPNIKWVSLVACDSDLVINWLKAQSNQASSATISSETVAESDMHGFSTPIDANRGLKKQIAIALPELEKASSDDSVKTCPSIAGHPVTLHRELKADAQSESYFPAISVSVRGSGSHAETVAVFPARHLRAGEESSQDVEAYIPEAVTPQTKTHHLQILADSGFPSTVLPPGFQMGSFSVNEAWPQAHWSTSQYNDGTPVGVTSRILDFDGSIPADLTAQSISPLACH